MVSDVAALRRNDGGVHHSADLRPHGCRALLRARVPASKVHICGFCGVRFHNYGRRKRLFLLRIQKPVQLLDLRDILRRPPRDSRSRLGRIPDCQDFPAGAGGFSRAVCRIQNGVLENRRPAMPLRKITVQNNRRSRLRSGDVLRDERGPDFRTPPATARHRGGILRIPEQPDTVVRLLHKERNKKIRAIRHFRRARELPRQGIRHAGISPRTLRRWRL